MKNFFRLLLVGLFLMFSVMNVSAASLDNGQDLMKLINDNPLGGIFDNKNRLLSNGSDLSNNLYLYWGNYGNVSANLSIGKQDNVIRQIYLTVNSKEDLFADLTATINNLYNKPTAKSDKPNEKMYIWQYDNYRTVLKSKINDKFTYDIYFTAEWNYLGKNSEKSVLNDDNCKNFIKIMNDLVLGGTFIKKEYLIANGSSLDDTFWFYKGNLGQAKVDLRVRKNDLVNRKVEISTKTNDNYVEDIVFAISNLYYKPTTINVNNTEQKFVWEYNGYRVTLINKLNQELGYDVSFLAEWL